MLSLGPSSCSSNFVQRLKEICPASPVRFDLLPAEHLFDVEMGWNENWIAEGRRFFLEKYWS